MTSARQFESRRWIALALLCIAQFMVVLDASISQRGAAHHPGRLAFSQDDLSWVVNVYVLTFGGFLLLGGRLADLLGRRRGLHRCPATSSRGRAGRAAARGGGRPGLARAVPAWLCFHGVEPVASGVTGTARPRRRGPVVASPAVGALLLLTALFARGGILRAAHALGGGHPALVRDLRALSLIVFIVLGAAGAATVISAPASAAPSARTPSASRSAPAPRRSSARCRRCSRTRSRTRWRRSRATRSSSPRRPATPRAARRGWSTRRCASST